MSWVLVSIFDEWFLEGERLPKGRKALAALCLRSRAGMAGTLARIVIERCDLPRARPSVR